MFFLPIFFRMKLECIYLSTPLLLTFYHIYCFESYLSSPVFIFSLSICLVTIVHNDIEIGPEVKSNNWVSVIVGGLVFRNLDHASTGNKGIV